MYEGQINSRSPTKVVMCATTKKVRPYKRMLEKDSCPIENVPHLTRPERVGRKTREKNCRALVRKVQNHPHFSSNPRGTRGGRNTKRITVTRGASTLNKEQGTLKHQNEGSSKSRK